MGNNAFLRPTECRFDMCMGHPNGCKEMEECSTLDVLFWFNEMGGA